MWVRLRGTAPLIGLILAASVVDTSAASIDFEGLPDSTVFTNQYAGLTFANAIVLTASIGLNEFEFPPHSGTNVVSDNGGPILISFSNPVFSFSGYFTYLEPLTLVAFDATNTQVASATSGFSNNLACLAGPPCSGDPGSSPNEFLQVNSPGGILSIVITGDPMGGSFVLDDVTYATSVPEPDSIFLLFTGILGLPAIRRKLKS
jgi:hypothetical protein